MMILRNYFSIYIPTKDKNGDRLTKKDLSKVVEFVSDMMNYEFGGVTITSSVGLFGKVSEEIFIAKSFCGEHKHDDCYELIMNTCLGIKNDLKQSAVAFESNGEMILV